MGTDCPFVPPQPLRTHGIRAHRQPLPRKLLTPQGSHRQEFVPSHAASSTALALRRAEVRNAGLWLQELVVSRESKLLKGPVV